jgi:hypothetical protein
LSVKEEAQLASYAYRGIGGHGDEADLKRLPIGNSEGRERRILCLLLDRVMDDICNAGVAPDAVLNILEHLFRTSAFSKTHYGASSQVRVDTYRFDDSNNVPGIMIDQ